MPYVLKFTKRHPYPQTKAGIAVPIRLRSGKDAVELYAKLDTGASYCIFSREYAEMLGLEVESGDPEVINTATGKFVAYGHEVSLSSLDYEFHTKVYFAQDPSFNRNVLGRQGWLDRIRLGIIEYDGTIYLSHYDDPSE